MTLFETLLIAHLCGDFILQTEWQALNKDHNWRAMLYHVATYHTIILAVLMYRFGFQNLLIYGVTGILAISHAIIDRRWPVLWWMKTYRLSVAWPPEKWLVIVIDQAIHVLFLGLAVSVLT